MRAKYIDCGTDQIGLWKDALNDIHVDVDLNTDDFDIEELPYLIAGYDICISDHTKIPSHVLEKCVDLKHFVYFGTGAASILDLALAERMGIEVHTIRNYGDTTVAELAAGLLFSAAREIAPQHEAIRNGRWVKMRGLELRARRLGIIGFGGIGSEMARICAGIGMDVVAWNRSGVTSEFARSVSLADLLATSDVVSLHLGLNEQTRHFANEDFFKSMKAGSILVNTARGGLVDEAALLNALQIGHIKHAALDVFETEPLPEGDPLRSAPNVTLTAHCGFWTEQSTINQVRLVMGIVEKLQA